MTGLEDVVPFARLRLLTERLAREAGVTVSVRVMPADWALDRHGATRNLTVWYPRAGAPAITVAHELAHVLTPSTEPEHGQVWQQHLVALTGRLRNFL